MQRLTTTQAAGVLGIKRTSLERVRCLQIGPGLIQAYKDGSRLYYDPADIRDYLHTKLREVDARLERPRPSPSTYDRRKAIIAALERLYAHTHPEDCDNG